MAMTFALSRLASCSLVLLLSFPLPSSAFDTPLSDTAVREAYFLGQRRDESMTRFLAKYVRHLSPPRSGPYISSFAFYTPFAQVILNSSQHPTGYSAQQAQEDHRNRKETIQVVVEIQRTGSYPEMIPDVASSGSGSHAGTVLRPYDFWRDFQVQFFDGEKELRPFTSSGQPNSLCGDTGACTLIGATLQFEFLAKNFPTDAIRAKIAPPEGDWVVVDFDLTAVR